ncbi:MAG: substrate-binding domain-containing protein, partial [Planctomycetota bacterium]
MQRKAIVPGPTIATTHAARVVTLMDCIHDYGRRALEGIARFGNTQGGWTLELHHEDQIHQRLPPIADNVVGIIAHAFRPRLIDAIRRTGLPAVNTSSVLADTGLPTVIPDNDAIGVTAADDLVRRGFHRLMTFVHPRWFHSVQRAAAFERTARNSGASVVTVELTSIQRAEEDIATSLADSPTPLGVFAGSDGMAVFAVRQCLHLGLSMPEQVAVLGVDNDSLTTRMMSPSISSVELPWEKLGYEAAARLHRLLQGEPDDDGPQLIPPTGVV